MNREDARKKAEVMMAYADGAELQFRYRDDENNWRELTADPYFNWSNNEYRIKPPQPKVIPFTVEDRNLFINAVVVNKWDKTHFTHIVSCSKHRVWLGTMEKGIFYADLLSDYVFDNGGEPCGKIQEEE